MRVCPRFRAVERFTMSTPPPLALLTDALGHLPLRDVLQWCGDRGLVGVELGVGGYSPAPHLMRQELLASAAARRDLLARVSDADLEIVALNASGNPLHPVPDVAAEHAQALRDAVSLAYKLGISRVVAMSGCPGGPGVRGSGSWPLFAGGAWLPDMEGLWPQQFEQKIAPFWRELSDWANDTAPDVLICLELHPGTSIYNAESFACLREVTADNIAVNVLSPSGLVATPGVVHHGLDRNVPAASLEPVEFIAEAAYMLCTGDAATLTGRATYAKPILDELGIALPSTPA